MQVTPNSPIVDAYVKGNACCEMYGLLVNPSQLLSIPQPSTKG